MIEVKNLEKIYSGKVSVHALKGVSFSVADGEFVAIMGRSGSGKSTLLHQLGLLDNPTSGEILVDNVNILKFSDRDKTLIRLNDFGYVFQEYALLPELNVLESVYLPLMLQGVREAQYIKRATEVIEKVGLKERIYHLPRELSGGEQQRVAIARAIVNNPKILFADEPCANLDTASSKMILDLLKEINTKFKQTIILVTHEPEDRKYVKRVIWLKDGLIEKIENS